MCYYKGNSRIPWEDSPSTGGNPEVSDAVVLSYVTNNQFTANTVSYYNNYDSTHNKRCASKGGCPTIGNQNIGINVGGDTYLPLNFPIFMYEYGWAPSLSPGPGISSGYYVGILQYNNTPGLGYFLTTQYINNPNLGYYDYYYSGSGQSYNVVTGWNTNYYFVEDNNRHIQGFEGGGSNYFPFMPPDQQQFPEYYQYGVFWLYNWFQAESSNMNIYFLMNGNILNGNMYGSSLATSFYQWNGGSADAIPPNPPANTINGEPIFAQSYINAYNTAFNQSTPGFSGNYQKALNNYNLFTPSDTNSNFIPGTFGYYEGYTGSIGNSQYNIIIRRLQDDLNVYSGTPYLFVSAGSGGGSGFIYLDWIIVTYGVPYIINVG